MKLPHAKVTAGQESKLVIVSVKVTSDETISSVVMKNSELRIVATAK